MVIDMLKAYKGKNIVVVYGEKGEDPIPCTKESSSDEEPSWMREGLETPYEDVFSNDGNDN
ncbi:unnamed protein product, partial [Ilex paraguariensis]